MCIYYFFITISCSKHKTLEFLFNILSKLRCYEHVPIKKTLYKSSTTLTKFIHNRRNVPSPVPESDTFDPVWIAEWNFPHDILIIFCHFRQVKSRCLLRTQRTTTKRSENLSFHQHQFSTTDWRWWSFNCHRLRFDLCSTISLLPSIKSTSHRKKSFLSSLFSLFPLIDDVYHFPTMTNTEQDTTTGVDKNIKIHAPLSSNQFCVWYWKFCVEFSIKRGEKKVCWESSPRVTKKKERRLTLHLIAFENIIYLRTSKTFPLARCVAFHSTTTSFSPLVSLPKDR